MVNNDAPSPWVLMASRGSSGGYYYVRFWIKFKLSISLDNITKILVYLPLQRVMAEKKVARVLNLII